MNTAEINRTYHTPPDIARMARVNVGKVLGWIRCGELRAIDVSYHPGVGKPRWRITPDALDDFECARSSAQHVPPTQPRRRKRDVPSRIYV